jgi:hypothetical protein
MGIAARLFFSTTDKENCLDWRVRPSDGQFDSQKERWSGLAQYLISDLAERSGYAIASWLQGSYKFGTQVRPANPDGEFDIDLGIYFQWSGAPNDGAYSPSELKNFVQDSLLAYAASADNDTVHVGAPRARCNRIHFSDGFHIDIPSYHLDAARDARALATSADEWEDSDPKAIYTWWKATISEPDRPRCRRIVRYLKMWATLRFKEESRPSSILLTVLVAAAFQELNKQQLSGDDEFVREIVAKTLKRLNASHLVKNPANQKENLNRLSTIENSMFIEQLCELLSIAERGIGAETKTASADTWSEAFDHFFPIPIEGDVEEALLKSESRAVANIAFDPQVSVEAVAGSLNYKGLNSIGPIPKGCDITFTLANADHLPAGATLKWMVRNSGAEAEQINDLGHPAGEGLSTSRDSAYRGDHFMDVTVKLNGRLIGSRRIPVRVTSSTAPLRNSPRPSWTRFRSGR